MSIRGKKWTILLVAIVLLVIDQAIKFYVKLSFAYGQGFEMFGHSKWAQILFIENNGMAFGMQLGGVWGKILLSSFRLVLIGILVWYIKRLINKGKAPWGVVIGFTMILVGAVGNMIDSAFYGLIFSESTYGTVATMVPFGEGYAPFMQGKVVDMFYFPMIHGTWPNWVPRVGGQEFEFFRPIFNFADSCITCGVIYMILFQRKFFAKKEENKEEEKKQG